MNSSEEEATAYHEAGRPPLCVSIVPDAHGNVGQTTFPNDWLDFKGCSSASLKKREYIEIRVLPEVAATFAHDLKFPGRSQDSGDNQDEASARDMIQQVNWVPDREEYLQRMRRKAQGLIAQHWPWIEAVARALIEKRKLRGCDLSELRPLGGCAKIKNPPIAEIQTGTLSASHGRCAGRLGMIPCARRHRSEHKRAASRRSDDVIKDFSQNPRLATEDGPTLYALPVLDMKTWC